MPERSLRTNRTHVTSLLGTEPPQDGKVPLPLALPSGSGPRAPHAHRYLPAGDYWFHDESSRDGKGRGGHPYP